jgi:hypothetical protein
MEKWLKDKGFVFHEGENKYWRLFSCENDPRSFNLLWIFPGFMRGQWTMQWHYDMDIPFPEIKKEIQALIDKDAQNLRNDKMVFDTLNWEDIFT